MAIMAISARSHHWRFEGARCLNPEILEACPTLCLRLSLRFGMTSQAQKPCNTGPWTRLPETTRLDQQPLEPKVRIGAAGAAEERRKAQPSDSSVYTMLLQSFYR